MFGKENSKEANIAGSIMSVILIFLLIASYPACSNPYVNPQTSKALSEERQIELLKQQNELLKLQTMQLKRMADALESKTK